MLMFAVLGGVLARLIEGLSKVGRGRRWIVAALGASVLLLIHSLVDVDLQLIAVATAWTLLLGGAYGAATRRR